MLAMCGVVVVVVVGELIFLQAELKRAGALVGALWAG